LSFLLPVNFAHPEINLKPTLKTDLQAPRDLINVPPIAGARQALTSDPPPSQYEILL
jgi:hypothetical protein